MDKTRLSKELTEHAKNHGIDLVGFTSSRPVECLPWSVDRVKGNYAPCNATKIDDWVYDPSIVLPGSKSVVIMGMYMYGVDKIIPSEPGIPRGKTGPWTRAYTAASKYPSEIITAFLKQRGYQAIFSNQLPYRTLALRAGLVNIGNNGFAYTKEFGSYIRLSCVVTDAELDSTDNGPVRSSNNCGRCSICKDICPTGALKGPHNYDYGLCLHQWNQGKGIHGTRIPRDDREKTGRYLMRTGLCLEMCPKNRKLIPRGPLPFELEDKPDSPELIPLVLASDDEYKRMLPYNVYKYGTENLRRDAVIALGNIGDPAAVNVLVKALKSMPAEIRCLAAWSLGKIGGTESYESLKRATEQEQDQEVQEEIAAAQKMIENKL